MKKIGKWILLALSTYCAGLYWKYLLQELVYSYWFDFEFAAVAICCSFATWCWSRDLGLFGRPRVSARTLPLAENPPTPKKTEVGKEMTELDLYVIYSRDLLDQHIGNRGFSIVLRNGFNSPLGNFWLECKKTADGKYDAKIFPNGSLEEVPYDCSNNEHLKLYRHFRLMLENYNDLPDTQDDLGALGINVVPIHRH
jgi:hypothetical protein